MKPDRISSKRAGWALLAIALIIAVTFRLMWLSEIRQTPQFELPVLDAGFNHVWAMAWSSGEWQDLYGQQVSSIPETAFFRPPGYAAFLSVIYRLFGAGSAAVCFQFVLGLLTILLIYAFCSKINHLAGGIGALVYALYWPALCYEAVLLDTTLSGFLLACTVLYLTRWLDSRRDMRLCANQVVPRCGAEDVGPVFNRTVRLKTGPTPTTTRSLPFGGWFKKNYYLVGVGLSLGLCALVRPNVLLFAPFAALMVFMKDWREGGWRNAFKSAALLTAVTLVVILPVTLRNWMVARQPVLISSNGGINFYIGNGPHASGVFCSNLGELGVYNQTDDNTELARGAFNENR